MSIIFVVQFLKFYFLFVSDFLTKLRCNSFLPPPQKKKKQKTFFWTPFIITNSFCKYARKALALDLV